MLKMMDVVIGLRDFPSSSSSPSQDLINFRSLFRSSFLLTSSSRNNVASSLVVVEEEEEMVVRWWWEVLMAPRP